MSATPPAPAPASRPRPSAAWLAFSAQMTAQVAPVAGRADLTVTVAPGAGRGAPACFIPGQRRDRGQRRPPRASTRPPPTRPTRPTASATPPCGARPSTSARTPPTPAGAPPRAPMPPGRPPPRALEESRIEARQVTRRPGDRAWLRACTCQIVIGDFTAAAAPPASAAEAGSAAALILAREDAGILETAEAEPVAQAVAAAIGEEKLGQLRQVWREAHRTRDDDAQGHGAARPPLVPHPRRPA